jgi:urease gamma subunit
MGRCARLTAEKYGTEMFGKMFLSQLRRTAYMFPPDRRHAKISWTAHRAAGHPDTLDEIIEVVDTEEQVTEEFVKDYLQLGRKRGKRGSKLSKKEQSALLATMKFMARATKAIVIAEAMQELVELHLTDLSPDHVAAMVESAMGVANKWTEIVAALRQGKKQPKRSHLQVV